MAILPADLKKAPLQPASSAVLTDVIRIEARPHLLYRVSIGEDECGGGRAGAARLPVRPQLVAGGAAARVAALRVLTVVAAGTRLLTLVHVPAAAEGRGSGVTGHRDRQGTQYLGTKFTHTISMREQTPIE